MAAEAGAFRLFAVTCVRTGDSDVSRITDAILVVNAVGCLALYINGLGRMFGSALKRIHTFFFKTAAAGVFRTFGFSSIYTDLTTTAAFSFIIDTAINRTI